MLHLNERFRSLVQRNGKVALFMISEANAMSVIK